MQWYWNHRYFSFLAYPGSTYVKFHFTLAWHSIHHNPSLCQFYEEYWFSYGASAIEAMIIWGTFSIFLAASSLVVLLFGSFTVGISNPFIDGLNKRTSIDLNFMLLWDIFVTSDILSFCGRFSFTFFHGMSLHLFFLDFSFACFCNNIVNSGVIDYWCSPLFTATDSSVVVHARPQLTPQTLFFTAWEGVPMIF